MRKFAFAYPIIILAENQQKADELMSFILNKGEHQIDNISNVAIGMPTMLDLKTVLEGEPKRATQRKDSSG